MYMTNLRKVGGSVMLAVPPAILEMLGLEAGSAVGVAIEGERLVIEPHVRPHYTLDELLAQCEPAQGPLSDEDRAWIDLPPVGGEEL